MFTCDSMWIHNQINVLLMFHNWNLQCIVVVYLIELVWKVISALVNLTVTEDKANEIALQLELDRGNINVIESNWNDTCYQNLP